MTSCPYSLWGVDSAFVQSYSQILASMIITNLLLVVTVGKAWAFPKSRMPEHKLVHPNYDDHALSNKKKLMTRNPL